MGLGYVQLNLLKTRGWVRFLQCAAFKQVFCGVDWNGVKYEIRAWNILLIKDILKLTKVPKSTYLQFLGTGLQDFFFFWLIGFHHASMFWKDSSFLSFSTLSLFTKQLNA